MPCAVILGILCYTLHPPGSGQLLHVHEVRGLATGTCAYPVLYPIPCVVTYTLRPPGSSQLLNVREVRGLAPADVLMLVVMEWCDLGSLAIAIAKRKFQPHGKWGFHTTYVRTSGPTRSEPSYRPSILPHMRTNPPPPPSGYLDFLVCGLGCLSRCKTPHNEIIPNG